MKTGVKALKIGSALGAAYYVNSYLVPSLARELETVWQGGAFLPSAEASMSSQVNPSNPFTILATLLSITGVQLTANLLHRLLAWLEKRNEVKYSQAAAQIEAANDALISEMMRERLQALAQQFSNEPLQSQATEVEQEQTIHHAVTWATVGLQNSQSVPSDLAAESRYPKRKRKPVARYGF